MRRETGGFAYYGMTREGKSKKTIIVIFVIAGLSYLLDFSIDIFVPRQSR